MAKVCYVKCPACKKDYYIDTILVEKQGEEVKMRCPYCKVRFTKKKDQF